MTEKYPDRLCSEQAFDVGDSFHRYIGVRLNGKEVFGVIEYCISEGWVRVAAWHWNGLMKMERGRVVTVLRRGKVELYHRTDLDLAESARVKRDRGLCG